MKKYGVFKMIQQLVALVISGMIVAQLLTIVNTQMTTGQATTVLKSPLWVPNTGVLLGMALIAVFAIIKLVEQLGGEVVKICFVMELAGLKGRERLNRYPVDALVVYEGK